MVQPFLHGWWCHILLIHHSAPPYFPPKFAPCRGWIWTPIGYVVPWAYLTHCPKWYLDQVSLLSQYTLATNRTITEISLMNRLFMLCVRNGLILTFYHITLVYCMHCTVCKKSCCCCIQTELAVSSKRCKTACWDDLIYINVGRECEQ